LGYYIYCGCSEFSHVVKIKKLNTKFQLHIKKLEGQFLNQPGSSVLHLHHPSHQVGLPYLGIKEKTIDGRYN